MLSCFYVLLGVSIILPVLSYDLPLFHVRYAFLTVVYGTTICLCSHSRSKDYKTVVISKHEGY